MVLAIHNVHPTWISVKFLFAFKLRWNFIVRLVECTYKLGHLGCVISFSIVGTADNDSDEEPVISLTMYMLALAGVMISADLTILEPSFLPQKTWD